MNYIEEILDSKKANSQIFSKLIKDYCSKEIRYDIETNYLRFIVINQLNLPKNKQKGKFEVTNFEQLFCLLLEEVYELQKELVNKKELDSIRILEEIGDIGAFLVGILAKLLMDTRNESYKTCI